MLTRAQIQRIAHRSGIGLQVIERDYLQHLLLFSLYTRSQALIFKGGTALRIAYRGNRYSEDLDFNGTIDPDNMQSLWESVLDGLESFGIRTNLRNAWTSEVGTSFDVSYQGPLYDGRDRSKGKVRIDINLRPEAVETRRELVNPEYDDLRPYVVTVLTAEQLLAEKVRAMIMRGKPRDAYDIWLMTQQGVRLDLKLVEKKLALYEITLSGEGLLGAIEQVRQDWERDLRPLLRQYIPWDDVAAGLASLVKSASDPWL
jgi:predicted nucleotidyltransferase component of viral defense system